MNKSTNKKLVVCMPCYNSSEFIAEAIESILTQSYEDFTFFILDDKSTDDTVKIVKQIKDPRIRLMKNAKNIGPAATRNKMINLAIKEGFEYMALMDSDDICHQDRFQKQLEVLSEDLSFGICGTTAHIQRSGGLWEVSLTPGKIKVDTIFHNPFPTPTTMIRLSILKKTKVKFDPKMVPCADYDFFKKLILIHNVPCVGLETPYFTYCYNPNGVSHSDIRKGQILKDIEIKSHLLELLEIKASKAEVTSFHDIIFNEDSCSELDFECYCRISSEILLQNEVLKEFNHRYLQRMIRKYLQGYLRNIRNGRLALRLKHPKTFINNTNH